MAYLLTNNVLSTSTVSATTFIAGSQETLFPFSRSYDGNPSTAYKSGSNTAPIIIINFSSVQTIDSLGMFVSSDSAFTVALQTNDTVTTSSTHANWTAVDFNKTGNNSASTTTLTVDNTTNRAVMGVSNTKTTNTRSVKLTFSNFSGTTDVVNHIQIGEAKEINITTPYTPALFRNFDTTSKRNNKGNPLISDRVPIPKKLQLKTGLMTQTDMATLVNSTYAGLQGKGFMVCTSYDLTVESLTKAYYCVTDGVLAQPSFVEPTKLIWTIKALGYN